MMQSHFILKMDCNKTEMLSYLKNVIAEVCNIKGTLRAAKTFKTKQPFLLFFIAMDTIIN